VRADEKLTAFLELEPGDSCWKHPKNDLSSFALPS